MKRRRARRLAHAAQRLMIPVATLLLRALASSWRVRFEGRHPFEHGQRLGALWHQHVLVASCVFRDSGVFVPVSRSQDGDLISGIAERLGLGPPPRGSSKRGAVPVLRSLVRLVREGHTVAILTDGPTGPARESKAGIVQVARLADHPIVPLALAARPALHFASWDRTLLPLPFARVVCRFGELIPVGPEIRGERLEEARAQLDGALAALGEEVERDVRRG